MLKRFLLLFFTFLLVALPAFACEHYPGQVLDEDLLEANLIPPQPGIAGSVDIVCPLCGDVIDHVVLSPLPVEAEHPASSDAENPPVSGSAVVLEPEPNSEPQQDPEPQPDFETVQPIQPEQPVEIQEPADPEIPAEEPENTGATAQVETSSEKKNDDPGAVSIPESKDSGSASEKTVEAPRAKDTRVDIPSENTDGKETDKTGTSTKTIVKYTERTVTGSESEAGQSAKSPETFPYRRVRMKPKPGLRAEAAGLLLWPVYGTPFQNIYSD